MTTNRNKNKGSDKENASMTKEKAEALKALEVAKAKAAESAKDLRQKRKWLNKSREVTIDRSESGGKKRLERQVQALAKNQAQSAAEAKKVADTALKMAKLHFATTFSGRSTKNAKKGSSSVSSHRKRK